MKWVNNLASTVLFWPLHSRWWKEGGEYHCPPPPHLIGHRVSGQQVLAKKRFPFTQTYTTLCVSPTVQGRLCPATHWEHVWSTFVRFLSLFLWIREHWCSFAWSADSRQCLLSMESNWQTCIIDRWIPLHTKMNNWSEMQLNQMFIWLNYGCGNDHII